MILLKIKVEYLLVLPPLLGILYNYVPIYNYTPTYIMVVVCASLGSKIYHFFKFCHSGFALVSCTAVPTYIIILHYCKKYPLPTNRELFVFLCLDSCTILCEVIINIQGCLEVYVQ